MFRTISAFLITSVILAMPVSANAKVFHKKHKQPVSCAASAPPAATPPAPAKPVPMMYMTPAAIVYGGGTIPGDSAVVADTQKLQLLQNQYNAEVKALQDKYQPQWTAVQNQLAADVKLVQKANSWDDSVTYDPNTRVFSKPDVATPAPAK